MTHVLKRDHLVSNLLLGELFADDVFVFRVIRTVGAGIHTVVGEIERRKKHNAVAVDVFFDFFGRGKDFIIEVFFFTHQKHCGFAVRETFKGFGFFERFLDISPVMFMGFCKS